MTYCIYYCSNRDKFLSLLTKYRDTQSMDSNDIVQRGLFNRFCCLNITDSQDLQSSGFTQSDPKLVP